MRCNTAEVTSVSPPTHTHTILYTPLLNPSNNTVSHFQHQNLINSSSPFQETLYPESSFPLSSPPAKELSCKTQNSHLPSTGLSSQPPWGMKPLSNQTAVPIQLFPSWATPGPSHLALGVLPQAFCLWEGEEGFSS